jgi:hypothetical protein
MKAMTESVRIRVSLCVAAIALSALPTKSFGLAQTNDTYTTMPGSLANDVVRIIETTNSISYVGTGTVISEVPDGSGGDWYNVLTADHVIFGAYNAATNGNGGAIGMGFNLDSSFPLSVASVGNVALDGAGNGPDLGLFAIDVTAAQQALANVWQAAALQPVSFMSPNNAGGNVIAQAGYGNQALAGNGLPAPGNQNRYLFQLSPSTYGKYLAASNSISPTGLVGGYVGVGNGRGGSYTFDAIQNTFAFTTNNSGTVLSGTSYILPGDSGGPTFETNTATGALSLIGVHSDDRFFTNNLGQTWATPGQLDDDVQISSYTNWIAMEIPIIDVPEPSSLLLASVGLVLLAGFWRHSRGRRS